MIPRASSSPPITPTARRSPTYPEIFALLMDRDLRAQWIATLPPAARGDDHACLDHARIFAQRDRHHDARRAGPSARPARSWASWRRRRRRHRRLRRRRRQGEDVPRGRARVQGRRTRRSRRRGDALSLGPRACRGARTRSGDRSVGCRTTTDDRYGLSADIMAVPATAIGRPEPFEAVPCAS